MTARKILVPYDAIAPLAVAAVAALFPGADDTDDGGGPYVGILDASLGSPDAVVELFVVDPDNDPTGDAAWEWRIQHDGKGEGSGLGIATRPAVVASWARSILAKWRDEAKAAQAAAAPKIHTLSQREADRLGDALTRAASRDALVRVTWDGGLKVKVGEGMWTPILSRPEVLDFDTAEALGLDGTLRSGEIAQQLRRADTATDEPEPLGITFSREQIEAWVGHALTDEQVTRIEECAPNSSIPDAIGTIADSLADED